MTGRSATAIAAGVSVGAVAGAAFARNGDPNTRADLHDSDANDRTVEARDAQDTGPEDAGDADGARDGRRRRRRGGRGRGDDARAGNDTARAGQDGHDGQRAAESVGSDLADASPANGHSFVAAPGVAAMQAEQDAWVSQPAASEPAAVAPYKAPSIVAPSLEAPSPAPAVTVAPPAMPSHAEASTPRTTWAEPAASESTAPAAVSTFNVAPQLAPATAPFVLPTDSLRNLAEGAGLQWVMSDDDKVRAVQDAMAREPQPIQVARQARMPMVVDEGPLVLVETKKDLSGYFQSSEGPR